MMHEAADVHQTFADDTPLEPGDNTQPARSARKVGGVILPASGVVQVPRVVRDALRTNPRALCLAALLTGFTNSADVASLKQDTLMSLFGRVGTPRTIARAAADLRAAGLVTTYRPHKRAAYRYRLAVVPRLSNERRYDELPWLIVQDVQAGTLTPEHVRTWLYLDQALGSAGWTKDSAAELAGRVGVSSRSVRAHVAALAAAGHLVVDVDAGIGWTLSRPGVTPGTSRHPLPSPPLEALSTPPVDTPLGAPEVSHGTPEPTPEESVRSPRKNLSGLYLPPVDLPPPTPAERAAAPRHLVAVPDGAEKTTDGSKDEGSALAAALADRLPTFRPRGPRDAAALAALLAPYAAERWTAADLEERGDFAGLPPREEITSVVRFLRHRLRDVDPGSEPPSVRRRREHAAKLDRQAAQRAADAEARAKARAADPARIAAAKAAARAAVHDAKASR